MRALLRELRRRVREFLCTHQWVERTPLMMVDGRIEGRMRCRHCGLTIAVCFSEPKGKLETRRFFDR